VAAQVAATVVLLVVAGLFVRTLDNLRRAPVGFDTESLLLFGVRPGSNGYEGERLVRFYEELRRRLEAIPGVAEASFSRHPMVRGGVSATSVREGGASVERNRKCRHNLVGPKFFATLRIPIRAGRALDERDGTAGPRAAVVNTRLALSLFGDSDPIGRHIDFGDPDKVGRFEIVGVVGDTRFQDLRGEMPPTVYLSVSQVGDPPARITYQLRAKGDAAALAPAVRETLHALDPNLPVVALETQRHAVARVLRLERLLASLTASFGLTALVLACVGLYGSLALAVAGRTREIGVRMALGAERGRVVGMVVSSGLRLVLAGASAGLAAALAGTRLLRAQLFGLAPYDPLSLAVAVAVLFAAAALACAIPARRASRIDPMAALKTE
jgi:predicted permease